MSDLCLECRHDEGFDTTIVGKHKGIIPIWIFMQCKIFLKGKKSFKGLFTMETNMKISYSLAMPFECINKYILVLCWRLCKPSFVVVDE